jgi:predicted alpha/beta hydrolase
VHEPHGAARAVVLIMPAMGVDARYYEPLAIELARRGYAVARAELRGHGASPVRAGRRLDFGYRELSEHAVPALVSAVAERWPSLPRVILGHSLGGQIASLYASLPIASITGLVLVASGSVDHRGWPPGQQRRVLFGTQLYALIARTLGFFPGDLLGFAGREPKSQILDWAHNARTGRWQLRGSERDWEAALAEVALPVLAVSLDRDDYAPHGAVDRQVAKLAGASVERLRLTQADTPPELLHHFRWARTPAPLVEQLDPWLTRVLS